jgi:hypothetical protein
VSAQSGPLRLRASAGNHVIGIEYEYECEYEDDAIPPHRPLITDYSITDYLFFTEP